MKISPDGQQLIAAATDAFQLWDLMSGREIFHWRGDLARIRDVGFSPQGTYVIASYHKDRYRERPARFWYASTGEPIDLFARLQDTPGHVAYARMSPDERQLITVSQEQIVTVWDLSTGQERYVLKTPGNNVEHVEFSPDGTFIIAVVDRVMTVFDAVTGTPRPGLTGGGSGGLAAIIFSRDGKRVISQTAEGLTIWDIAEGQPISTLAVDTDVLSVEFSPDGQQVVTAATAAGLAGRIESFVQIWDVASGAELFQLTGHTAPVNMASYSPDGKRIVTASADKTARVWDATSDETLLPLEAYRNRELYVLKGHSAGVSSAVFAPDGKTIVTTSADRTVRIWDIGMHLERLSLQGHTGAVRDAQFSPDGTAVLTASDDQTAILWDAATGKPIYTLAHPHAVTNATFSPDGSKIVTVGKNHPVRVWSRATGEQLYLLAPGSIVVFSPDGKSILTVSQASGFLWDASTGRLLNEFQGHTDLITSAVFAPNGIHILTASYDTTARIWDTTGQLLHVLQGHRFPVYKAVYSPTGASIATVYYDGTIRLWNTGENRDLKVIGNSKILEQQGYPVTHAVFSPDGKRLVTAETSTEILGEPAMQIWDMQKSQLAHELQERTRNLQDGAFSQDSTRFVSASYDGNAARVWDVETGQPLYALLAHTDAVTSAVFSPDGKSILTAARDGTARIWPARWQEMLVLLNQQHVRGRIRQFTAEERQRYGFPD